MKKSIIVILILALAVSMIGYFAFAAADNSETIEAPANENSVETSAEDIAILTGMITSLENDQLTMHSNGADYLVLLTENTQYEGKNLLEVGDFISVQYDGKLTRSLPAQLTADLIACHVTTGVVSNLTEGQFLLTMPDESQFSVVYDAEMFPGVQDTMTVTVYYNGTSTRSLPPQISAEHVRTQKLEGTVSALTETGFLLTDADGIDTLVHIGKKTFSFVELTEGMKVAVTTDGTATMSLPAQVNAIEILPAA